MIVSTVPLLTAGSLSSRMLSGVSLWETAVRSMDAVIVR